MIHVPTNLNDDAAPDADALIAEYLERQDRGESIDGESFLMQIVGAEDHKEFAGFLEASQLIEAMAGPTWSEHLQTSLAQTKTYFGEDADTHPTSQPSTDQPSTDQPATYQPATYRPASSGVDQQLGEYRFAPPIQLGRYLLERPLGQGAMGTVFLAHDTQLDRPVALKFPTIPLENAAERIDRFFREARAAAALRNPHLCPVYDVGQIDGVYVLAMAFIDGEPLSQWIQTGRRPTPRRAAQIIRTLALALEKAHQEGVIHRDLKPSNILMDYDGQPVVTDFGLACFIDRTESRDTQAGVVVGSPAYMAPEQFARGEATRATDVYSLGVVFIELLTGRLPHEGSLWSMVGQAARGAAPALRNRSETVAVPLSLTPICQKMIAPRAEERYQSMADAAADLEKYLVQSQPPIRSQQEAAKWATVENMPNSVGVAPVTPPVTRAGTARFSKGRVVVLGVGVVGGLALIGGLIAAAAFSGLRTMTVKRNNGQPTVTLESKVPADGKTQVRKLGSTSPAHGLRYGWKTGARYAYEFDIEVEDDDGVESLRGTPTYHVEHADAEEARLTFHGGLISIRTRRNGFGVSLPRFGGFSSPFNGLIGAPTMRPHELFVDRHGKVKDTRGDSQLPFALGNLSLLAIERFPDKPVNSWKTVEVVTVQNSPLGSSQDSSPFPSTFRSRRKDMTDAHETVVYTVRSNRKHRVVLHKKYQLLSTQTLGGKPRYLVQGEGETTYDAQQQLPVKGRLVLRVVQRIEYGNENARARINYRLLSEKERLAMVEKSAKAAEEFRKKNEEKEKAQQEQQGKQVEEQKNKKKQ